MDDTSILHLKPGRQNGESKIESAHFWTFSRFLSLNFATQSKFPLGCLPVSGGYDIVYRRWWGVSGGAEGLTQTIGPRLGEYEPVSNVELRQQAVVHYLIQVIPWGTPQAAAEHGSIQGCGLREETIYLSLPSLTTGNDSSVTLVQLIDVIVSYSIINRSPKLKYKLFLKCMNC